MVQETNLADTAVYRYDYFSGASIGVWVKDVFLADIVGVEFSLVQLKMPVWGWASQLYDAVAQGIVQVTGTMYMNFQEPHMLPTIISRAGGATYPGNPLPASLDKINLGGAVVAEDLSAEEIKVIQDFYWGSTSPAGNLLPQHTRYHYQDARRPDDHGLGFDIRITYGNFMEADPNVHAAVRSIINVHLTSFGQSIEIDGKPILEAYNFLAREVR